MRVKQGLIGIAGAAAGVGVAIVSARGLVTRQAAIARRRIGKPLGEVAIPADRVWKRAHAGEPLELLMLGDSLAAGLGARTPKQTLGARLARGVAVSTERPVRLRTLAVVGSETSDLPRQLDALGTGDAVDVAVIVVGGNDVTHRVPIARSLAHLEAVIRRLRERGVPVVVGTCPDLGALRAVPQPLRRLVGGLSRRLAAAQAEVARRAGAVPVDLRRAVGAQFSAEPDMMFSGDRFHPSALGYRHTAAALLPAVVGVLPDDGDASA